jgi:hypothetical protein
MGCRCGHWIIALSLLNVTVQPAFVIAMRLESMSGNVWTVRASGGRCGIASSAICVDIIVSWLATWTVTGHRVGCLLG